MIRFKFRCSAFGFHYYDCIIQGGETFEVRHTGTLETFPDIEPHWSGKITPEVRAAWRSFLDQKHAEYLAWLDLHPDIKTFVQSRKLEVAS